jgi:GlpG protein
MRLVGTLKTEAEAYAFYTYLLKDGIPATYETGEHGYRVWVRDEDDFDEAFAHFKRFQENPGTDEFKPEEPVLREVTPTVETGPEPEQREQRVRGVKIEFHARAHRFPLTNILLALCIVLFFWNGSQQVEIERSKGSLGAALVLTSLQKDLLFDYPYAMQELQLVLQTFPTKTIKTLEELPPEEKAELNAIEKIPTWKGFYDLIVHRPTGEAGSIKSIPMFEKIKEGEVWRLVTPIVLHHDFLHILFNMAWLWILGRQIEDRIKRLRMILLIVTIGVVSNVAQYLMSGPFFLGFSGVVIGMAGFIWMRQKIAPWEGYPLQRSTLIFILMFIGAIFVLEFVTFALEVANVISLSPNIANTAHIVGGLVGVLLGRLPLFARIK